MGWVTPLILTRAARVHSAPGFGSSGKSQCKDRRRVTDRTSPPRQRRLNLAVVLWSLRNKCNNHSGDSLWSASAWSRFGSQLVDSLLRRHLNDRSIRRDGGKSAWPVSEKCPGQGNDYQSGSKRRRSKISAIHYKLESATPS